MVDLTRIGAWGQLATIALAVGCWVEGFGGGLVAACVGYLGLTVVGIAGIARRESLPTSGPIVYPFLVPGFVPLYYFATKILREGRTARVPTPARCRRE